MAETLTSKTTEFSSGVTGAIPLHSDSATSYLYPVVHSAASELGGVSVYSFEAAADTNPTVVKSTAGQMYGYTIGSIDATPVVLRTYDVATAPTLGTTTIKTRHVAGAATTASAGRSTSEFWPMGIPFSNGIAITVSTAMDDAASTGSLTANEVLVTIYYK